MIENLFVIGNGFDLGHGMQTSYLQFKEWLTESFPGSENTFSFVLADTIQMPDGDEYISDENLAGFLVYCVEETSGEDWSNFEETLGQIDWVQFFDSVDDVVDKDGDIDFFKSSYVREDFTSQLYFNAQAFSKLFTEWVNDITYPKDITCNYFFTEAIKKSSVFLTFNYTRTLEDIYGISSSRICHIHGVQGGEIIVGHGIKNSNSNAEDYESEYDFGMEGIDDICNYLRKPTEKILENTTFFKELKDFSINNIFSWGFSFSCVDQCYIEEICRQLDTRTIVWYLHVRKDSKTHDYEDILRKCGFKGRITTFSA